MWKSFHLQASCNCSINICATDVIFLFCCLLLISASHRVAMSVGSVFVVVVVVVVVFPMKSRKGLAHNVMYAPATQTHRLCS